MYCVYRLNNKPIIAITRIQHVNAGINWISDLATTYTPAQLYIVLQRKPFAFELFFSWANTLFWFHHSTVYAMCFNVKVKNLAFDTSNIITNVLFSMKN